MSKMISSPDLWPSLSFDELAPTVEYLHRIAQVGAKYTLDQPFQPNWGNIVMPITPRGFATPTLWCGDVSFIVEYELLDERVSVNASTGRASVPLAAGSVAEFYRSFVAAVSPLGIPAPRSTVASEIAGAPHLDLDEEARPCTRENARKIWSAFASASRALLAWQASYRGPRLPVGIMWGGFDLYAARYNGRPVKPPDSAPVFQQNGMTAEVVAVGFYFGDARMHEPSFFAYISPPPAEIATADFGLPGAAFNAAAGLISVSWETVRSQPDPHAAVLRFADSVYGAAVDLGGWPRDLVGPRVDGWYASSHRISAS